TQPHSNVASSHLATSAEDFDKRKNLLFAPNYSTFEPIKCFGLESLRVLVLTNGAKINHELRAHQNNYV
ncbi:MAG: hypothetical protein SNI72_04650, partial [Rikenellaceae bacterium]